MRSVNRISIGVILLAVFLWPAPPVNAEISYHRNKLTGQYDELVESLQTQSNGVERVVLFGPVADKMKMEADSECGNSTTNSIALVGDHVDRQINKLLLAKVQNSRIRLRFAAYGADGKDCQLVYMELYTKP